MKKGLKVPVPRSRNTEPINNAYFCVGLRKGTHSPEFLDPNVCTEANTPKFPFASPPTPAFALALAKGHGALQAVRGGSPAEQQNL